MEALSSGVSMCGEDSIYNVATLKFADRGSRFGGRRSRPLYQRQPLDRLKFPLDIPENAGLGLPVAERVPKSDELSREKVSHTFIRDQIAERPWDLICFPSAPLKGNPTNCGTSADLVIVLFLNGIERIDLELMFGVVPIVCQELILHCQSEAS